MTFPFVGPQYLRWLSDDFGIWQHTHAGQIDRTQGYALDDSARGLITAVAIGETGLAEVYLSFLERSCAAEHPTNFFTADRQPWDRPWSPDASGEVAWSLGACLAAGWESARAASLWQTTIVPRYAELERYSRATSYLLLGSLTAAPERVVGLAAKLAAASWTGEPTGWIWPEDELSYANAIIPHALLEAARHLGRRDWLERGLELLEFLNRICSEGEVPSLIGNRGWYKRGAQRARFDQQPIDAAYQVLANLSAYKATRDKAWLAEAERYFSWFWGNNIGKVCLVDLESGRCHDGLWENGKVSPNAGAENVVCFLYAQQLLQNALEGEGEFGLEGLGRRLASAQAL